MRGIRIALVLALFTAGCGPSAGDRYYVEETMDVFYDRAEADRGGPPDKWSSDLREGKKMYVQHSKVQVIESDGKWTKIKIVEGDNEGTVGWIEASYLRTPL